MKLIALSLFDSKTACYSRPMLIPTMQMAERVASDLMSGSSDCSRHPEDFSLFHIGEFDDSTALFSSIEPVVLYRMHEYKAAIGGSNV